MTTATQTKPAAVAIPSLSTAIPSMSYDDKVDMLKNLKTNENNVLAAYDNWLTQTSYYAAIDVPRAQSGLAPSSVVAKNFIVNHFETLEAAIYATMTDDERNSAYLAVNGDFHDDDIDANDFEEFIDSLGLSLGDDVGADDGAIGDDDDGL